MTVPKLTDEGLRFILAWTPLPFMGMVTVGSEPPLVAEIARRPLALPVAVGVNSAVNVVFAPAASA